MIRILYIVSTLRKTGPTNQLKNIITYLNKDNYEVYVLTLSPEIKKSFYKDFEEMNINLLSLNLGRIEGLFLALPRVIRIIKRIKPDIIHSQGIRSDVLSSFLNNYCISRFLTLRNYALEDYSKAFGMFGKLLARIHWFFAKSCKNVCACSELLAKRLNNISINAVGVSNGVNTNYYKPDETVYNKLKCERPFFIVSGSLNERKNNIFILNFFNRYLNNNKGTLVFIGSGIEEKKLKDSITNKKIQILGSVNRPLDYLQQADVIISSSKSEGLPNSILEGLSCGLPAVLSNIPGHLEIKEKMPDEVFIYNLDNENDFMNKLNQALELLTKESKKEISEKLKENFSAEIMSRKYQNLYLKSLE